MNKKVFSLLAAGAITTSMLSGVVAHAAPGAEDSKNIEVTYDNQTVVTDPDHPTDPQWQVAIPSGINFTDDRREVKADVELQNQNGGAYTGDAQVKVSVSSQNEYKLVKGLSKVDYTLGYGSKTMTNGDGEIATLTQSSTKSEGKAKLGDTNKATEVGQHTDTLTYTVQNMNNI
ncbi:hypothetical protein [Clostridium perfringens]|uniref:hypothetical protein n=1 Tax=Clostridium perfringens TaxID=1502 RepID=UPI0039E774D7